MWYPPLEGGTRTCRAFVVCCSNLFLTSPLFWFLLANWTFPFCHMTLFQGTPSPTVRWTILFLCLLFRSAIRAQHDLTQISIVLEYFGLAEFDSQPKKYLFAPLFFFLFLDIKRGGGGNGNIEIIFNIFFPCLQSEPPGPSWVLTFLFPPLSHSTGCPAFVHTISSNGTNGLGGGTVVFIYCLSSFPTICSF